METRSSLNAGLFVLLGLSIMVSGCSRQLHTALASSDDSFSRQLASLFSSPSMSEGPLTEESPQPGEGRSSLLARVPVNSANYPNLGNSQGGAAFSPKGQPQNGGDIQGGISDAAHSNTTTTIDGVVNSGLESQQSQSRLHVDRVGGDGISIHESLSPTPDDITPLNAQDVLTELAAASASGELSGNSLDATSTNGSTLTPLGDELFGQGDLGDVFFDFDAASIRSDAAPVLRANAQLLKDRFKHRQIIIEGHADERGTAEYNLVLGERRAQSSKKYLVDLGVSASTIQTISYGKEKPFCQASNADCWKLNRRGHFVLQ